MSRFGQIKYGMNYLNTRWPWGLLLDKENYLISKNTWWPLKSLVVTQIFKLIAYRFVAH